METGSFTITPSGPFSLAAAAAFGFGQRGGQDRDGLMRLAFCLDGYQQQVGVELRQDGEDGAGEGEVRATVSAAAGTDMECVRGQVSRVLSLDYDGAGFVLAGQRDPVLGRLQAAAPGLRPPLFYSPYEAAAWSVLSARRPAAQMMQVRDQLSRAHGTVFDIAGQQVPAFPTPARLLGIDSFPGLPDVKMKRLHGVAAAALDGRLDAVQLMELGPERAAAELRSLDGIGPFYSALIVIRGTGFADVLPVSEPKVLALTARLYDLAEPPSPAQFAAIAEPWQPFRTWATVLIRAAGPLILGAAPDGGIRAEAPAQER